MQNDSVPSPQELAAELRRFVQVGVRPANMPDLPKLLGLSMVGVAALGTTKIDRALALVDVLREAVRGLGDGPASDALDLLLGLTPRSRGLLQKDRRDLAADALGVDVATWRRHWEKPLLLELATELYRMENEQRVVVRVRSRSSSGGTALADLQHGKGGKSLDRREAEARIFSTMYALRADLLAATRLRQESKRDKDHVFYAESALYRLALFVDAMSRFTDSYGDAIVMAGNEVTVREAASLLGWQPPLNDEQIGLLRIRLTAETSDAGRFITELEADERGQQICSTWLAWLEKVD